MLGLERLPGVHAVFNLEVEGLHQYHVSPLGLLAHNNDCREVNGGPKAVQGANEAAGDEIKSGVYHIKSGDQHYTGSSLDVEKRLSDPKHPARAMIDSKDSKVEITPVDVSHNSNKRDQQRGLFVVEQDVMNEKMNIPRQNGSMNKQKALGEKKHEAYRQKFAPKRRGSRN